MVTVRPQRTHAPMTLHEVEVRHVLRLSPHLVRVTFTAPSLVEFVDDGPDQRCKLLLPREGQQRPWRPPATGGWYQRWRELPDAVRPTLRTYTIRRHRPESAEIDIDFVLHGGSEQCGPASAWAARARTGDRAVVFGGYAEYDPPANADWQLIAGDDTALPAIGAILERLPESTTALVYLEVDATTDQIPLAASEGVEITWLFRAARAGRPVLADTIRTADFPVGDPYVWVAGEAETVKQIRRHLVHDRAMPREAITFMGYWRIGGPIDPS